MSFPPFLLFRWQGPARSLHGRKKETHSKHGHSMFKNVSCGRLYKLLDSKKGQSTALLCLLACLLACLLQRSPRSPLPSTPFSACYYISVLGALQWGKRDLGESGESSRHRRRRRLEDSPSISANSGQTSKIWYNVICLFAAVLGSWDKGTLESFVLSVQHDRRGRLAAPDWR